MSYPSSSVLDSGSSSSVIHRGVSLANTVHSEVAPCLPLPSLPVFCGASDQASLLFDAPRSVNRIEVLAQSSKIAYLLQQTDVSYLTLRDDAKDLPCGFVEPLQLHDEVVRHSQEAFEYIATGPIEEHISIGVLPETKPFQPGVPVSIPAERVANRHQFNNIPTNSISTLSSRKSKIKKTAGDEVVASSAEVQDAAIGSFCDLLEDLCSRAEITTDDQDESEWSSLPLSDIRKLVNEIMSIRAKKLLHLISVDILVRLLKVLDHQIHRAEGLSIDESENSASDLVSTILSALESIHAALAVMAHNQMPKQLYKEEVIERILDFTRRQMMDVMCASDPSFRALHKPSENEGDDYEEYDGDFSASKKKRVSKITKVKRSTVNRSSAAVNTIIQKLCTVLGLLKELILIEKLSDSCILQLVKTSCTTFLVDNIQLLQLKAIGFLAGVFYSYGQHRTYIIDEMLQSLWKLPSSKRASRAYHLPEEEQRQIQMITALLIQLVHSSANLPDILRQASTGSSILEVPVDANYPTKCNEAATDVCCLFWSRVLQRFASVKTQDASELKSMMENLVTDLLTTLNLPEYPASAPILEVLCVLLLQNAGLKSKDITTRSMAIDLLGTIASRLKRDAVACGRNKFWMLQDADHRSPLKDVCSVCLGGRIEKKHFVCEGCQEVFHADCMGVQENHVSNSYRHCQMCFGRKQLIELRSCYKSQLKDDNHLSWSDNESEHTDQVAKIEVLRQLLLNYLQDVTAPDDVHLFIRWFYVCLWYKDDPKSQLKLTYYIARLKSITFTRDSGSVSHVGRDFIKKITLALGQNSSFSRGFDKILHMLLASLRENSPVIRAKALKAVSIIVEADPEVLGDKRVQSAIEGRFCDSAISVREAALELVGRHIASHPDVGFKYFEKIAERVKDTGVSVRKRAIKLIRDMCTSNVNFSGFTRACVEIISRVSDDESSIQDLVCKTFYDFWFEEPSGSQSPFFGVGSSIPVEVAQKTEKIVDMSRRLPNHQLLVTVIRRNLSLKFLPHSAKAVGINPVLLTTVRKRCELMCKCLLEKILQIEEMNNDEVETKALPYVLVLHSFCVVDPTLCAPASDPSQFVVTLQPYLKSQVDSRAVAQLLESIIFIIDSVLPSLRKLPESVVEELEQDLKQMIVRHSFLTVVHACIKCICSVSRIAGKGAGVVHYLIQIFFKRLDAYSIDNKQQVGRSLFCLGLLIRYGNALLINSNDNIINTRSSLSLFLKHLSVDDLVIKVRSLQALGFLLIARPEYMLEKDIGIILEASLSSESDVRLRMQALQNIFEYLLDAESQLGTNNASDSALPSTVEAGQTVPVAAGAGETNICGGIVQLYWDNVLDRCLDTDEQVRQLALKIVEVVLRQGLVHPITSVPFLIALETDPQEVNSKLAHHLLMNMNEKYPAFFEIRLGDGLQTSFHFIQSISGSYHNLNHKVQSKFSAGGKGKLEDGSFIQAKLGVSRIYKLIRGNQMSRNKFMTSIVRKFDNPNWNNSVIPFLIYCTEVLASLPFTSPDEPLYLIYAINRVVQVRAGSTEENMKALSSSLSHREPKKMPHENGIHKRDLVNEVQIPLMDLNGIIQQGAIAQADLSHTVSIDLNGENQHQSGVPFIDHSMPGNTDLRSSVPFDSFSLLKDDLQKIQPDCLAAIALQLLLKLKRYLKIVYSLNDERCQAYSPTEPPKPGEVLSRQSVAFDIRETNFSLPTTSQELVQKYQEFKNALREDTIDYAIYTANIKRKRPGPRRNRRSGRMAGGDYDDDDDNEDETWTGSARKLQYTGRRSSARDARHH